MEDSKMWVYVVAVVVAVILIIIAVLAKKRNYGNYASMKGMIAQGGILGFFLFLLIIGFMTYGSYRIDNMLNGQPSNQMIFRVFWGAQLIFLILFFFAYRMPKAAVALIICAILINAGLFAFFTTLTQENMVPSWCYFPYIVMLFMLAAASGGTLTKEGKEIIKVL